MEYIKNADYNYIMNKYHDQSKPFDSFKRFIRHDEIFDSSTGMDGDEIIEGIKKQDKQIEKLSHPVRKAKAFEFVLKNTRISCNKCDIFPAINAIDRPLNQTIVADWRREVFNEIIPDVGNRRKFLENNGVVTIWPDYDHGVPMWERVFELGFLGLLRESEEACVGRKLTDKEENFFEGIKITYTAIIEFLERLQKQAEKDSNIRMSAALNNIKKNPPRSFYEALLVDYIFLCYVSILRVCRCVHFPILIDFFINIIKMILGMV